MKTRMHAKFSSYQTKLQNVYHHQKQIDIYILDMGAFKNWTQFYPSFDHLPPQVDNYRHFI